MTKLIASFHVVAWYAIFGCIHELSHIIIAAILVDHKSVWKSINWIHLIFHRRFELKSFPETNDSNMINDDTALFLIRHTGWIVSIFLALAIHLRGNHLKQKSADDIRWQCSKWCQLAAYATALDAFWTDFLKLKPLFWCDDFVSKTTFFCGNFGIILLNTAWLDNDGGQTALKILQKMIEVTMMRGAQSGGVVTFKSNAKRDPDGNHILQMKSILSRVVKSKRNDLSKILISKLKRDAFNPLSLSCIKNEGAKKKRLESIGDDNRSNFILRSERTSKDSITRFFAGHTRFATSSKANLDGTHPHQWTPLKYRRVYNFFKTTPRRHSSALDLSAPTHRRQFETDSPLNIPVENFISHNGDFDFFDLNGFSYDVGTVQQWLAIVTASKIPSLVDSAAIAGMVDIIRCKGCFSLSCRYVVCLGLPSSEITSSMERYPSENDYHKMGLLFEEALCDVQKLYPLGLSALGDDDSHREAIARKATWKINQLERIDSHLLKAFDQYVRSDEDGASSYNFAKATVDAFFDNDLFFTVNFFMKHAKGSFGLCVVSSLDAHSQMCLAARGQTISIAFYPKKGLICYGSEQAAVKAGMLYDVSGSIKVSEMSRSILNVEEDVQRLDLDDVGGEICLIDWSGKDSVSRPTRNCQFHKVMNNKAVLYLYQESMGQSQSKYLYHRQTKLSGNPLILPLKESTSDPVLQDLQEIPRICQEIQDEWRNATGKKMFSLNRLTAVNLRRRLKQKLDRHTARGTNRTNAKVDIMVTGCEVSLWLGEQFASDLQKSFPRLCIQSISSNKLLGLLGQEDINVPTIGFPTNEKNLNLEDAIIIIISHSGGTFGPLACSSLLQSMTKNIFVISSEWDNQIGRQLRLMTQSNDHSEIFDSHIFTTGVGLRPAEPCSISVVATHQLLTNIFQYLSIVILSDEKYRQITGAMITERDLQILERCNRENIFALEAIVGVESDGAVLQTDTEAELRNAGDLWAEHVLENAKAYIMSFIYIFATVIMGFPLVLGISRNVGLSETSKYGYLIRVFDAIIYFFLPQINILILRLIQKRPLRHRMVSRTVVIGDIPWVAQAAEAFLSKLFACSYSIAGLNVHSANPSDHFVHRMTHRVVRGTLLCCGRPDGRLSALTAAENAVSLSINQASSIQSLGSTCETVTIGHNKFKLPLSSRAIFLDRYRPLFLCEYILAHHDKEAKKEIMSRDSMIMGISRHSMISIEQSTTRAHHHTSQHSFTVDDDNNDTLLKSIRGSIETTTTNKNSSALLGHYKNIQREMVNKLHRDHSFHHDRSESLSLKKVLRTTIQEKKWITKARQLFEYLNIRKDGKLQKEEFITGLSKLGCDRSVNELSELFSIFQNEDSGYLSFDAFFQLMAMHSIEVEQILFSVRDSRGIIQVGASQEQFFGQSLVEKKESGKTLVSFGAMKSQHHVQELYEARIASLQRFVSMTVMFHQMGSRVQQFFPKISFGLLGYRMDRSHSIMRIATTASPISGNEIRERAEILGYLKIVRHALDIISNAWLEYRERKKQKQSLKND